jgi:hypothetical protein
MRAAMPIAIDTSEAPTFLRLTVAGCWPRSEDHRSLRARLQAAGQLTPHTRAVIDLRSVEDSPDTQAVIATARDGFLPFMRAYLVGSAIQYSIARQFKAIAGAPAQIGIFTDEREALLWLWNADRHS